jgi:probable metal-binding protein
MSIHGHEILNFLVEKEPTAEELKVHVAATYGSEVKFHTCSTEEMSLEELIVFLEKRGKFVLMDGRLVADPEKICSHND